MEKAKHWIRNFFLLFISITTNTTGGSGSSYVKDYVISTDANALWMPATNGPDEWIQVDMFYLETVIQALTLAYRFHFKQKLLESKPFT